MLSSNNMLYTLKLLIRPLAETIIVFLYLFGEINGLYFS